MEKMDLVEKVRQISPNVPCRTGSGNIKGCVCVGEGRPGGADRGDDGPEFSTLPEKG